MKLLSHTTALGLLLVCLSLLSGCSFHRTVNNSANMNIDISFITIGETKWTAVIDRLGPPVILNPREDATSNISKRHLRYACFESKCVRFVFPLYLLLPFRWCDERAVNEYLIEFDEEGRASEVVHSTASTIWRPLQGEQHRLPQQVEILSHRPSQ